MEIAHNKVKNQLYEIFYKNTGIDFHQFDENIMKKNLFSSQINLQPFELVYVFYDIEEIFDVKFSEQDIVSGKFFTLESICKVIENNLNNVV